MNFFLERKVKCCKQKLWLKAYFLWSWSQSQGHCRNDPADKKPGTGAGQKPDLLRNTVQYVCTRTPLEKFCRISLYVADAAIAKLYL